ncbi:hypothetical protein N7509_008283 [Penicillium cosmopolitanum]|uniref:Uncharacterized protein n=1 Tax=Penicillium cosmopolitanum TaxID=1131564 RepID=A0A9W9VMA2_9EURO|nr:uncharacterized protein N7509_008283 [Penicillium cosmopolitanum]KAJ5385742.1 hypothetical protein N7509_008283 [Penicillium cosmopolitanum]
MRVMYHLKMRYHNLLKRYLKRKRLWTSSSRMPVSDETPPLACNVLTASVQELQQSMCVAFLPLLAAAANQLTSTGTTGRDEGRGVIVVTSSCASMHNSTNVDLTSYATSKAATDHLVKLLAAKYNRFYVRVVGINPGSI